MQEDKESPNRWKEPQMGVSVGAFALPTASPQDTLGTGRGQCPSCKTFLLLELTCCLLLGLTKIILGLQQG